MLEHLPDALLWGLLASGAMITILHGSVSLGLSRLNLPLVIGTLLTGRRHRAVAYGLALYLVGGWLFALIYFMVFSTFGYGSWWFGALIGLLHGAFLVTVALPLLPHVHPRMVTNEDDPSMERRLEPPGPFGLNYGRNTPLTTLVAQAVYGAMLGAAWTFIG